MTRTQRQIEQHRQEDAVLLVRDKAGRPQAGLMVWAEQETHEFPFGCVVPDLAMLSEVDRIRYSARLDELFNRVEPADQPPPADALRVTVADNVHLGMLRLQLDRLAAAGQPLDVHIRGETVGMADRSEGESARQVAELYTLCFAHPSVQGITWHGFWDGEKGANGLLRGDLAPKPAYRILHKLFGDLWHSRASGQTDAAGCFAFRGFRGTYRVISRAGEQPATVALLSLGRRTDGSKPFILEVPGSVGDAS